MDSTNELEPIKIHDGVALVLWMPSMGHGSSPTRVKKLSPGYYRAEYVHFLMPGAWELLFQIKSNGTVLDEAVLDLII